MRWATVEVSGRATRATGHSAALDSLQPRVVQELSNHRWQITLTSIAGAVTVDLSIHLDTVDVRLPCSSTAPARVRRFQLHGINTS